MIAKGGDLAAQLTALEDRDVLFIDEIHRLNPAIEEILYPAMEDFQLDLMVGTGPGARSVKIDLAKFTLIGATTRAGLLTTPLRDRFGIPVRLDFYNVAELETIVRRNARLFGIAITDDGGQRDRQTRPRHAACRRTPATPGARLRRGGCCETGHHSRRCRPCVAGTRCGRDWPRYDGPALPQPDRVKLRRRFPSG